MSEVAVLADERLVSLDRKVDAAEGDGILARWEFGRELLAERVGKQLPKGRLDEITAAVGKSRNELQRRMIFAERYPTKEKVLHAVQHFRSWHDVWSPHVSNNSGQNEWYTPAFIIEAARSAMGSIDLDPASSDTAQATVQANEYFTAQDDGLIQPWFGNIWLNPPYAQPLIGRFIDKLLGEDIDQAVVLVNNATETGWGSGLLDRAAAVCFPLGRIRFLDPDGNPGAPLQGQMITYLGRGDRFADLFAPLGPVLHG